MGICDRMSDVRLATLVSHPIQYQAPLFRELDDRDGLDLTVYFCSRQGVEPVEDPGFGQEVVWDVPLLEGYEYEFLSDWSPIGGGSSFFSFNPGIKRPLRGDKHDVLWIHGYESLTNLYAITVANRYSVPVVFRGEAMPSTVNGRAKQFAIGQIFDHIDAFASIGTRNRHLYESFGIPDDCIFHAPYSVNNEFFQRRREELPPVSELRREESIPVDRPVVLFVGKFLKRKRPGLLLDAFVRATDLGEATLIYVGEGELRPHIERRVEDCGRTDDVIFVGFVNQSELPRYYGLADIFVLPSVRENWGLVINEAMNFQLPIITTDDVGASEDLVQEDNGAVVKPDSIKSLIQPLSSFLKDRNKANTAGRNSIEKISKWDIEATANGIIEAVTDISQR